MRLPTDVMHWPIEWFQLWAERAAIKEFQGNMSRKQAEEEAEADIRRVAAHEPGHQMGLEMKF